jgi:hypothetical protein
MGGIEIKQASLHFPPDSSTTIQAYLSEAEIYNDYSIPPLIQSFNEIKQEFSQQTNHFCILSRCTKVGNRGFFWCQHITTTILTTTCKTR